MTKEEQYASIQGDQRYLNVLSGLSNDLKVITELHKPKPEKMVYLVSKIIVLVEDNYNYIDIAACEGAVTSCVQTWYDHQKLEYVEGDPVKKMLGVLALLLQHRNEALEIARTAIVAFAAL